MPLATADFVPYDGVVPPPRCYLDERLTRLQAALGDRYTLERELGQGGMATVYLAKDRKHDRAVAIKVLKPEVAGAIGVERFLREIHLAARLQHPHILPLHDSGFADGFPYYVMPYVAGETLRSRLERERQLPLDDALRVTREVAEALDYAHRQGVVHRDIKPENILLTEGQAIIADFGIAHAIAAAGGEKLTATGIAVGTPLYMSPEQSSGETQLDGRSDVYSLGCVVFEMLAGEAPYTGPSAQAVIAKRLSEPVPHLRTLRNVPQGVEEAVTKALERAPADRFATAAQFAAALGTTAPKRRRSRTAVLAAGATLVAAGGAALLLSRANPPVSLDPDLVAVAPFEVLDPKLELWREGLMDVLSHNLDGAGPLRTVPPTVVLRRWRGPPDAVSAAGLGKTTGARLAVFGNLLGSGGDSVRLTASIIDVANGRRLGEVEVRDAADRMDRLADSGSIRILSELGHTRAVSVTRLASLGSASLPALKAFLQGEQFYRRVAIDSALSYYAQAVALDSGFALALMRMSWANTWFWRDSLASVYVQRAVAHNRGLSARDSMVLTAESLRVSLRPSAVTPDWDTWWDVVPRLFGTLEEAGRRYPDDPEIWYLLGEARFHFGLWWLDSAVQKSLDAFTRAIELDSGFAPAYEHLPELALDLGDTASTRRYARTYLSMGAPAGVQHVEKDGYRIVVQLLDPSHLGSDSLARTLDTASTELLTVVWQQMLGWPDSGETAVQISRRLATHHDHDWDVRPYSFASRGHLREAFGLAGTRPWFVSSNLLTGAIPAESIRAAGARWLRQPDSLPYEMLWWWSNRGDTVSLTEYARRAGVLARANNTPAGYRYWRTSVVVTRAYLALALRDTTEALRWFDQVFDGLKQHLCPCGGLSTRLVRAKLLAARSRDQEAASILEGTWLMRDGSDANRVFIALERGRVNERLKDRERAIESFDFVVNAWRNADPELQPYVAEARAALRRLEGEPQ